jgi:prepilin-type N-terminal cleavage/methylation domain-containing protein
VTGRGQAGYSLIEMMVASGVSLMLLAAGATVLYQGQVNYADRQLSSDMQQRIRVAFSSRLNELRVAGSGVPAGMETIDQAEATVLGFLADIDGGSAAAPCTNENPASPTPERIVYSLVSDNVVRQVYCWEKNLWVLDSTGTAIPDVQRDSSTRLFRYFAANGAEIGAASKQLTASERAAIVSIEIAMTLQTEFDSLAAREGSAGQRVVSRIVLRQPWAAARGPASATTNTTPVDTDPVIQPADPVTR